MKLVNIASAVYLAKQVHKHRKTIKKAAKKAYVYADDNCDAFIYGVARGVVICMLIGGLTSILVTIFS